MPQPPSDRKIIAALHAAMGKVCLASEKLGCPPEAIYARARAAPRVRAAIRFYRGKLLDAAESALWKGILEGQPWAVRLALSEWGRSRDFSDGAEAWHSPRAAGNDISDELVRKTTLEILNHDEHVEDRRARQLDFDSRPVRLAGERRPLENDAAPGGDRPGDRRDDPGPVGTDSGD
jgi:hypothetical protein